MNIPAGEKKASRAFTLIELMIVVAIIGILAAIAIPKFADMVRKSQEGATKGNLSSLRSAINIYYGDNEGLFPSDDLTCLTEGGKYIKQIPEAHAAGSHAKTRAVQNNDDWGMGSMNFVDSGAWLYWNWDMTMDPWKKGDLRVGCTHTDLKGAYWTDF